MPTEMPTEIWLAVEEGKGKGEEGAEGQEGGTNNSDKIYSQHVRYAPQVLRYIHVHMVFVRVSFGFTWGFLRVDYNVHLKFFSGFLIPRKYDLGGLGVLIL